MKLLIVTPAFGDDGTGAGSYYAALTSRLSLKNYAVEIVCHPRINPIAFDRIKFLAFLPNLPALGNSIIFKIRSWLLLEVGIIRTANHLRKGRFDCLLVHDAILAKSLCALPLLRLFCPTSSRRIVDVRAPVKGLLQRTKIWLFGRRIIACSRNTLESIGARDGRTFLVPIPLDEVEIDSIGARLLLEKIGVDGDARLVLYAGRLKRSKGVPKLIKAFLSAELGPKTLLILVGADKLSRSDRRLLKSAGVVHLGIQPRNITRGIMSLSSLIINISPEEGLSRSMLEAISLERPVLLPPNTPEFNDTNPELVVDNDVSVDDLSLRIRTALDEALRANYDLRPHNLDRVVDRTIAIIEASTHFPHSNEE